MSALTFGERIQDYRYEGREEGSHEYADVHYQMFTRNITQNHPDFFFYINERMQSRFELGKTSLDVGYGNSHKYTLNTRESKKTTYVIVSIMETLTNVEEVLAYLNELLTESQLIPVISE